MLEISLGCQGSSEFGKYAHNYSRSFHHVTFYPADGGRSELVFNGAAYEKWQDDAEAAIRKHHAAKEEAAAK